MKRMYSGHFKSRACGHPFPRDARDSRGSKKTRGGRFRIRIPFLGFSRSDAVLSFGSYVVAARGERVDRATQISIRNENVVRVVGRHNENTDAMAGKRVGDR